MVNPTMNKEISLLMNKSLPECNGPVIETSRFSKAVI